MVFYQSTQSDAGEERSGEEVQSDAGGERSEEEQPHPGQGNSTSNSRSTSNQDRLLFDLSSDDDTEVQIRPKKLKRSAAQDKLVEMEERKLALEEKRVKIMFKQLIELRRANEIQYEILKLTRESN
eukprot:TRINITY_DN79291_c0_g1_i1.p1 TRINITY_DN79291_c0_g1~~TRINITY_DN79291_c0_g1_i1.p1  ORF type:complete len:140 (-),score=24.87 TRINITY_DN79291_c0_g1_i1:15-392(-)